MTAYCSAMAVHGVYPFGPRSRAVNDLGNQFVPFHAHLWDLMHGNTSGDLVYNWGSGFGVPFLADFFTYLMNPFSWLVGVVPRDKIEFPVFMVTVLSIGLGTGLMTVFLGRLQPGSGWLRALLAVGYGVSSWTTSDGWADPMWMWGIVSFPLMGIAGDWCLRRCHWPLGVLAVAVCWAGNFYTAAMATIGMGLVFGARVLLDARPWDVRCRVLLRGLSMTVVGVLLAAPVVTVSYKASKASQPVPDVHYAGPPGIRDYLAHLLPGGYYVTTPRIAVGILALLLVFMFPFMRHIPWRQRTVWSVLLVLVGMSYVWEPTILAWHGGALPNGSPYRAAIALTVMLVATAWLTLSAGPGPREICCGLALLALLVAGVGRSAYVSSGTWFLSVVGGASTAVLLWLLWRYAARSAARTTVICFLTATVFVSTAASAYSVTVIRDGEDWWQPKRTLGSAAFAAYRVIRAHDTWPLRRSDPGPHAFASNDPLLLAGEGGAYYSSYVPAHTARTMQELGAGWTIGGRHLRTFGDPVGRAIMGTFSYLEPDASSDDGFTGRTQNSPPVITLRAGEPQLDGISPADSTVFDRRNRVLGSQIYSVPQLVQEQASGESRILTAGAPVSFSAQCPAADVAYLFAPWYSGTVHALGTTVDLQGRFPMTSSPLVQLGQVPADGRISITFTAATRQSVPRHPLGCLDSDAADETVRRLASSSPSKTTAGGHSIKASFAAGTTGTAVLAIPAVDGWRCSSGSGRPTAPKTLAGLITVPVTAGDPRIACSYRTPGLYIGCALSILALTALLITAGACTASRRRTPRA
ncbi:YfhO family protein [Streptomyces sp. NPDC059918]